jgi:hypothetical protein
VNELAADFRKEVQKDSLLGQPASEQVGHLLALCCVLLPRQTAEKEVQPNPKNELARRKEVIYQRLLEQYEARCTVYLGPHQNLNFSRFAKEEKEWQAAKQKHQASQPAAGNKRSPVKAAPVPNYSLLSKDQKAFVDVRSSQCSLR